MIRLRRASRVTVPRERMDVSAADLEVKIRERKKSFRVIMRGFWGDIKGGECCSR